MLPETRFLAPRDRLKDGTICQAEVHWYEAHGIGKKEMKIKYILGE